LQKNNNVPLHLMGLVSNGGVHSHKKSHKSNYKFVRCSKLYKCAYSRITDGRDTDKSGYDFEKLQQHLDMTTGKIATTGRYYAMWMR
jgi:2,3-bisphosphoglycerate-independent phosphoglycerate mutase